MLCRYNRNAPSDLKRIEASSPSKRSNVGNGSMHTLFDAHEAAYIRELPPFWSLNAAHHTSYAKRTSHVQGLMAASIGSPRRWRQKREADDRYGQLLPTSIVQAVAGARSLPLTCHTQKQTTHFSPAAGALGGYKHPLRCCRWCIHPRLLLAFACNKQARSRLCLVMPSL